MNKTNRILTVVLILAIVCTLAGPAVASNLTRNATLTYRNIHITLDGTEVLPTDANGSYVEPFIIDGTTYLPVRGIASALGLNVAWDADTSTVQLYTEPTEGAPVGPTALDTWTEIPYPSAWYGALLLSNFSDGSEDILVDVCGVFDYSSGRPFFEVYLAEDAYEALDPEYPWTYNYLLMTMWVTENATRVIPDIRAGEEEAWLLDTELFSDDAAKVSTGLKNGGLYFSIPDFWNDTFECACDVQFFLRGMGTDWDVATDPILPPSLGDYLTILDSLSAPGASAQPTVVNQTGEFSSQAQGILEIVNDYRAQYGLPALKLDETLCTVAQVKAQDMHDNGYFSHTSPTYGSPYDLMDLYGVRWTSAAENIACGQSTVQAVMTAWMNSEGHRANILNESYTKLGVGYVADGNYWVQEFTN